MPSFTPKPPEAQIVAAGNLGASYTLAVINTRVFVTGTLNANLTLNAPTGASAGTEVRFKLTQDATGGRTLTLGAGVLSPSGTTLTLTGTANSTDFVTMVYDGTNWYAVVAGLGFR